MVDAGGNSATNTITIDTEGSEKINGVDTLVIETDYGVVELYSDGSNWFNSQVVTKSTKTAIIGREADYATSLSVGDPIPVFDTTIYNNTSSVTINSATQIILSAGKKYKLIADMSLNTSAAASTQFKFYNVTDTEYITSGSTGGNISPQWTVNHADKDGEAYAIIDTSADTTIELRITAVSSGTVAHVLTSSCVIIEELN